jgi:hypothetical protein
MGIVVVFTFGLVAANTAAISIRERRTEIAARRSTVLPSRPPTRYIDRQPEQAVVRRRLRCNR